MEDAAEIKEHNNNWLSPAAAAGGKQVTATARLGVNRCKSVVLADCVTAVNDDGATAVTVRSTADTAAAICVLATAGTTWPKVHTSEPGVAGMVKVPTAVDGPVPGSLAFAYDMQVIDGLGLLRDVNSCISSAAPLQVMVAVYVMVAPGSR
jgi:hypothetical protein